MDVFQRVVKAVSALLVASGIGILAYINVADWMSVQAAEGNISEIEGALAQMSDEQASEMLEQARRYNRALSGKQAGPILPYEKQLSLGRGVAMAYLEIPKIAVRLPVYHGAGEDELMNGVGHLQQSSLPVGGPGTRCVLLAHSGMRNARMFDELYRLSPGDEVIVHTLGTSLAYRVFSAEVAKPKTVERKIAIPDADDLVTLITCTPYGVNTERLLVHARRTAAGHAEGAASPMAHASMRLVPLALALGLVAISAAASIARRLHTTHIRKRIGTDNERHSP